MPTFTFNPVEPVILVNVTVQGPHRRHLVRMILDTGATFTMLAPEILLDIGLDPAETTQRRTITTASGIEYVAFLEVPTIKALGVACHQLAVCAHGLPPNIPARGLLGLNFFRHFNLHLNFRSGTIDISA